MDALAEPLPPGPCERCGGGNSPQARFCQHCGTALGSDDPVGWYDRDETPTQDDRPETTGAPSIVSALVCELSAAPTTEVDDSPWATDARSAEVPAALELAREILRRFGAAIEDLPGAADTVAAVFGPEPGDGDGPVMALRAASELRRAFEDGSVELRAGVGTAEILGEGPDAENRWRERVVDLATGLQRRAEIGDVIVAESVSRRIGGAAELEPVDAGARTEDDATGPLRLLEVDPDPATVSLGWPRLAGRDEERSRIRSAFARAVAERTGVIVQVLGDPGVGKTRLAEECLTELAAGGAARTGSVRWGPASEPGGPFVLAGLLEAVAGLNACTGADRARAEIEWVLEGHLDAERVAEQLLPALGLPGTADPDGTGWALRRYLEAAAAERPLALLLDDADRAGPWLLELLRSAVLGARGPILVLATGPAGGWPPGWEDEPVEQLGIGALGPDAMGAILADLVLDPEPPSGVLDRLVAASRGNALHLEHLAGALADRGSLRWEHRRWVPAQNLELPAQDLQTLLSLRVQDLELKERAYLGLLAVAGAEIPSGLVEELVPNDDEPSIRGVLAVLVARRFLRVEPTGVGDTYTFDHELVRDVARASVPPEIRAQVHERCVRWLEERDDDRLARHAAAIAAHLEAEASSALEAGSSVGDAGPRAAGHLASTAMLLAALGDEEGRLEILERASALLGRDDRTRAEILLRAAEGLRASRTPGAADRLSALAMRAARDAGDGAMEARARLLRAVLADRGRGHDRMDAIWEAAEQAELACRGAADEAGLSAVWSARAEVHRRWGHWAAAADDAERAADHAARAGLAHEEAVSLRALTLALEELAAPVDESIARCRAVMARAGGRRLVRGETSGVLAVLLARAGSFEEAEVQLAAARSAAEEVDPGAELARVLHRSARVESLAGRQARAEELLGQALDAAARAGEETIRAAIEATLAHVMLDLGRAEEALELADDVSQSAAGDDVVTQVGWRSARARALASLGNTEDARMVARQAIRLAEQTDLMDVRAGALLALAEVLLAEGRPNEAAPFARRALRALQRRGAVVPAGRARSMLESIGHPVSGLPAAPPGTAPSRSEESGPAADAEGSLDEEPEDASGDASDGDGDDEVSPSPFADIAFGGERYAELQQPESTPKRPEPDPEPRAAKPTAGSWWSFGKR